MSSNIQILFYIWRNNFNKWYVHYRGHFQCDEEMTVEGLFGVTIDGVGIVLININEIITKENSKDVSGNTRDEAQLQVGEDDDIDLDMSVENTSFCDNNIYSAKSPGVSSRIKARGKVTSHARNQRKGKKEQTIKGRGKLKMEQNYLKLGATNLNVKQILKAAMTELCR